MALVAHAPEQSAILLAGLPAPAPPADVAAGAATLDELEAAIDYTWDIKRRRLLHAATGRDEALAFRHTVEVAVAFSPSLQPAGLPPGFADAVAAAVAPLLVPITARLNSIDARLNDIDACNTARFERVEARRANGKAMQIGPNRLFIPFQKLRAGFAGAPPAAWPAANVGDTPPANIFPRNTAAINAMDDAQIAALGCWYNEPRLTAALAVARPPDATGKREVVRDWICE